MPPHDAPEKPPTYRHKKVKMEELGNRIAEAVPGMCFALVIFPPGAPGIANYITNAEPEGVVEAMRAGADSIEKRVSGGEK